MAQALIKIEVPLSTKQFKLLKPLIIGFSNYSTAKTKAKNYPLPKEKKPKV